MNQVSKYHKDLVSTFLNQIWRVFSGPLMLFCIPYFLTPEIQGYWYTFISLAALSVLADLGFSNIVLQFSAHEFAFLRFNENNQLEGDKEHFLRLADFFHFSLRWLLKIVLIAFPLIMIGGYAFLSYKTQPDKFISGWQEAWFLYSFFSAFVFMNAIILSFFEGCNLVGKVQKLRFQIAVLTTLSMLVGLILHLELFALALSNVVSSLAGIFFIIKNFKTTILQFLRVEKHDVYDWWPEFSNLIWRYAISWGSGFLVFQLFTPMTFYFYGPIAAGKIGISIAMWTAGFNIAISWITAITPRMNILIAEKDWIALDELFHKGLIKSFCTMFCGGTLFFLSELVFYNKVSFFKRILEPKGMGILFFAWLIQIITNAFAVYLRAHKKEPLVKISCFNALVVAIGTFICCKLFDESFLFCGFLLGSLIQCPIVYLIFRDFKKRHLRDIF